MTEVVFVWRLLVAILNGVCLLVLLNRFRKFRNTWKPETRDYWWTLVLWSLVALAYPIQGIIEHRKLTVALVFLTIASLATPIGLRRKARERSYLD